MLSNVNNQSNLININNISYNVGMKINDEEKKRGKEIDVTKLTEFGKRLYILLKLRKMKPIQLAAKLGVSQPNISKLMYTSHTGGGDVWKMARILDADVAWLAEGTGADPRYSKDYEPGKIPVIAWTNIPDVKKDQQLIHTKAIDHIVSSFKYELNIYAVLIPSSMGPDALRQYYEPGTYLIINPIRPPQNGDPIIMINDPFSEPEYVIYGFRENTRCYKYFGEYRYQKMPETAEICGVIVARVNIYIPLSSS